jgi:sugar-specific transcriptional regulator TrmB
MKAVNEYLKHLGLSEIESKLYLGLLEVGSTTVMELANHVGIKRITAHFNVESLIAKGLITETRKGARRQIVAEDPEKLHVLLEEQELQISQIKQTLPQIIQSIAKNIPKNNAPTNVEVRYYEGKRAVKHIYDEVLNAKELRAFVTDTIDVVFPENADLFIKNIKSRQDMKIWEIINDSPQHEEYISSMNSNRYHCKVIDKKLEITDHMIYDNNVAIISVDGPRDDQITGVVITGENFYQSSKTIFEFVWSMLPNYSK